MILVKSLTAMATEKLLLKTSGQQFLDGVDYMYRVGLSPDRLSVMETASGKFILQFHSRCDLRPFAVYFFHRPHTHFLQTSLCFSSKKDKIAIYKCFHKSFFASSNEFPSLLNFISGQLS